MKITVPLRLLPVLICGVISTVAPAPAQEAPETEPPPETEALPGPPGTVQIATRARVLADSASAAERTIQRLLAVEGLTAEVEGAERRYRGLQALLASMIDAEFVRLERLSRLRDQALIEDGRLEEVGNRLTDRLVELGELDARWMERGRLWRSWLDTLRAEADGAAPETEAEVTAALERIDEVLEAASAAAVPSLALQGRVEALRGEIARLGATVTTIQARRRRARFERAEPILFSEEHRAQLREGGWRAWDPTASIRPEAYWAFARGNVGLLVFHALLALLIAGVVRALPSSRLREEDRAAPWTGLREHPWALGVAQVQEILREAAFVHPAVLEAPPPQALFMAFGDSSLDFELRVWVKDIRHRLEVRSTVLAEIDRRLREAGIVIPFPQRDLHLRSVEGKALEQAVDPEATE